jgi:hypothetical protein
MTNVNAKSDFFHISLPQPSWAQKVIFFFLTLHVPPVTLKRVSVSLSLTFSTDMDTILFVLPLDQQL